jgi:two-component system sensor histidine kinase DegS
MEIQSYSNSEPADDFYKQLAADLQSANLALSNVKSTLDQSQNELVRLTQKKATVTALLQQYQSDSGNESKADIRTAYNAALDAQQRLLVMRGQLEKLMEQKAALQNYSNMLEKVIDYNKQQTSESNSAKTGTNGISTLEMLINAQEAERQRLSRQMHDGPAQALSNFIVQSEIASRTFEIDPLKAKDELEKLKNSAMNTFQKIRSFISELRPMSLDDLGLVPTLKKYAGNVKEQTGVDIAVTITGSERRLDSYLEVYIFRAMQELITNAIKHNLDNASKLRIDVNIILDNSMVRGMVKDNGKGIDQTEDTLATAGLGLKLIRERAQLLGGSLTIKSSNVDGTEVTLSVPVASPINS